MHELSLAGAVLETSVRHAEGHKVSSVQMKIGRLRQVVPDSLSFYFEIVARGSVCEGARLEPEVIDALLRCEDCEQEWDPAPPPAEDESAVVMAPSFRCPSCGEGGATVLRGQEFEVESIVVEDQEEEAGCIAPR